MANEDRAQDAPPYGRRLDALETEILGALIAKAVAIIDDFVGPGYRASILIRHEQNPKGHIFGGGDVPEVAALALDELRTDPGAVPLYRDGERVGRGS